MTGPVKEKRGAIRLLTQWLPIIAFFAAALYLWRSDFAPEVQLVSVPLIVAASGMQLLAFAMRAWLLRDLLQRFGIPFPYSSSVSCVFKPILSKYIPGKVWGA